MNTPERILIIRPSALGDVCRSVPVLASLRRAYPDAQIDWLVQESFSDAIRAHPDLSNIVAFPRRLFGEQLRRAGFAPVLRWLRELKRARYDLVLDCQGLARSGLFAWATRAPRRVGFAQAREMGWLGLNQRQSVPRDRHTVDRMLALLDRCGVEPVHDLTLHAPPEDQQHVTADPELNGKRFAVIAPTSRWPAKRWPIDRFASIAQMLVENHLDAAVIVGAQDEIGQCSPLLDAAKTNPAIIDRVGATTIGSLMALIERAQIIIANDSAALHMAVGFNRPLVALYGPTDVSLVGPYRRDQDVIQHLEPGDPIEHKDHANVALMERISVEEVFSAAKARLS